MATIRDVVRYFVTHYPYPNDLDTVRLTKLVFLADWAAAQHLGRQLTPIRWYFDHYGPYVPDIAHTIQRDRTLHLVPSASSLGHPRRIVRARVPSFAHARLSNREQAICNRVIAETQDFLWGPFIAHVYRTYPLQTRPRYTVLPLVAIAREIRPIPAVPAGAETPRGDPGEYCDDQTVSPD